MTIVGMAIVVVQLWREVGPLRTEVRQLRDEVGRLSIDDPIESFTRSRSAPTSDLTWKWRVWVPAGRRSVDVNASQWGNVPDDRRSGRGQGSRSTWTGRTLDYAAEHDRDRDRKDHWLARACN